MLLALIAALPARAAPFAATVMDARTGEILFSVNDTTRLHPASLTKMMTLYVVFEAIQNGEISLDTMVRISRRAASEPPSRLGLREGQRIALRHLIRAAALRSGNDAATAIAEAVSGSVEAFTRRMNRTAAAIGMSQTSFRNAHGLTASGHLSSARDMTILGRQLYFDFPQYYGLFSRRSEDAGIARVANTNSRFLDGYSGADGIKTGFTNAAGYNLTAMAERGGVRIVVTVFGGRSVQHRHDQVVQLMDRGFRLAPGRAAVRRPARPDYSRPQREAPQVAAAETAPEAGASGSRAAGRVIRLQTAPQRSLFPQRRPGPAAPAEPSEALLAAVQQSVETALAAAAPPPDAAAAPADAPPADAPARSPNPPPRPAAAVAALAPPEAEPAADVEAARAAGFTVIEPEVFAALADPAPAAAPATVPETPVASVAAPAAAPPPRPEPDVDPTQDAALAAAPSEPVGQTEAPPLAFAHAADEIAAATVENGLVVIPGLPPIPAADTTVLAEPAPALDLPTLDPRPEPALVVTAAGQVLWHDEDILTALDEVAPPVGPAAMVLTTDDAPAAPAAPVMPEVVIRASISGGQTWAVDLGPYGSRFDAERTLLRVALAESTALSGGVRRVVEGRGYRAMVVSLTEDQANRACARLAMMAQPCTVVAP